MSVELYSILVKPRPHLWWWVKEKNKLSAESIVEGILAFGDMEAVKLLFKTMGKQKIKKIFTKQISTTRCNYKPQTVNYFKKVFSIDV
ncbi:MAG: hypothetical protein KAR45_16430 [Desulfobacteraceae bacterium]|nr:hypothetical protein [Desulfobacteraceae bacterium]